MPFTGFYPQPRPAPAENYESANARVKVMMHFQDAVNAGNAVWHINEDGEKELHMHSGEVFLLEARTITRLK